MSLKENLDGPTILFGASMAFGTFAAIEYFDKRKRVLRIASGELGESQWHKYLDTVASTPNQPIAWCGIFALWVLHQAGLGESIVWNYDGRGFLYRLPVTKDPKPGDLAYMASKQHHAIVERVDGDVIQTLDGNSAGRRVARNRRPRSKFLAFYSIQPLINGDIP